MRILLATFSMVSVMHQSGVRLSVCSTVRNTANSTTCSQCSILRLIKTESLESSANTASTSCSPSIRFDNELFIEHSKANNNQLNLSHCAITEKNNDKKLKSKNKNLRSTGSRHEAV